MTTKFLLGRSDAAFTPAVKVPAGVFFQRCVLHGLKSPFFASRRDGTR
jgi:hypothetical protein